MSRAARRQRASNRAQSVKEAVVVTAPTKGPHAFSTATKAPKSEYDGDAEFIEAARTKTMFAFDPTAEVDGDGKPFEVIARLFEVSTDGRSYKLNRYSSKALLKEAFTKGSKLNDVDVAPPHRLREAKSFDNEKTLEQIANEILDRELSKLRESFDGDSNGYGNQGFNTSDKYGDGRDASSEYIPMMAGPWSKQLYETQYREMHSKAFEAYNHNPIAHQLCELQTAFCLGRGLDHQSTNTDVDQVWREFVDRTDFYTDLENIATDMWWAGEMMMEFYDDAPEKGYTDYRMIDPSTILDIITDPEDIQKVYYAHQQYSTPYQNYTNETKQKIDAVRYIIRQIPADDFLHVKLNVSKYEKRGRSDLFSVLGWVKRLKDLMNARVIKGQLEAAFVWDVEVDSGDRDVQTMALNLPDPYKAGSTFVHNKNIKLTPQSSSIKGNDQAPDVAQLLNMIAVGFGIPKEFIGEAGKGGAKSGALAATEPGTKRFEKRQRLIERICHTVASRVILNAINAGRLSLNAILADARSVSKLADAADQVPTRDSVQDEMEQQQDEADSKAEDIQNIGTQMAVEQHKTNQKMSIAQQKHMQAMEIQGQKNQHRIGLATAKNTTTNIKSTTTNDGTMSQTTQAQKKKLGEGLRGVGMREADDDSEEMNSDQKERIKTLKDQEDQLSKEFLEFIFPAIAQEDRSAKLKDLALAEAMQWLPKSMSATLAAKELSITTYNFEDVWRTINEEAELGMSIAHVYAQDNQHVPQTTIAQDVQAELAAKQPTPSQQFQNVPIPPPVAGDKLVPAGGQPGQGGPPGQQGSGPQGPSPGNAAQSGSTKVNQYSGPASVDPTAGSHGYSAAANHPMTAEGQAKAKESIKVVDMSRKLQESVGNAIARRIVQETLGGVIKSRRELIESIASSERVMSAMNESA